MLGNGGYAMKKRKKPVQKNLKPPHGEVPVKTNPSKRHRDRLNGELDHLTSLLPFPEEVRGRLDKLSVLRLSVGYLKVKSYFHATLQKNAWSAPSLSPNGRTGQIASLDGVAVSEGDLLLQALNGFVLVVMTDGSIFYTSPTIHDFLGFHQSDVVHQRVYDLIHMDDRETFRCQLHFALNPNEADADSREEGLQSGVKAVRGSQSFLPHHIPPENSSFLERNFCCRFRCLLDNSSGFLALNFQGRLKYLHGQGQAGDVGTVSSPPLALFAIATPVQPPSVMVIRTKTLIFQTKHRMDFAPLAIDTRGKVILGYSETELKTRGSGYQFVHAADMMYCADNHLKMMKTGESGFTAFRLLTKTCQWLWVQATARVVFKAGKPDFIIARQKLLTNEEGEERLLQRRMQVPFNFATGEGVLYESCLTMDSLAFLGPPGSDSPGLSQSSTEKPLDPASVLGSLLRQDRSIYTQPQEPFPQPLEEESTVNQQLSLEQTFMDSHALLSVPGQLKGSQNRPNIGDPTSQAMLDSLEQILGEIGDGGVDGLEVEETDLREWERALLRMNMEMEDVSREIDDFLANDVFSYVEEALKRETVGCLKSTEQIGPQVAEPINSFSVQPSDQPHGSMLPGNQSYYSSDSSHTENQWQLMTDMNSNLRGFGDLSLMGNALGVVGDLTALKSGPEVVRESHRLTHTQSTTAHQGDTSQIWPPNSSGYLCGNQMASGPSHNAVQSQPELPDQTWIPPIQNTNTIHNNQHAGLEMPDQSVQYGLAVNHTGTASTNRQTSGQPYMAPQPQGPPQPWQQTPWQPQQQLPQSLHHHTLIHSSQTPLIANSTTQPLNHRPSSGSCMFEKREGCIPPTATVPTRQNCPVLSPTTTFSPPGMTTAVGPVWPGAPYQGMKQLSHVNPQIVPYTDMGSISGSQLSGESSNLGAALTGFPPENGSIQTSYFYWNRETQIPSGPPNGGVEPFTFSALPKGSTNISQRTGP